MPDNTIVVAFMPAMTANTYAASKLKIKASKKTVQVKKSVTLKATGLSAKQLKKVKWSTTKAGKKVVKLSKKKGKSIKVTGKKAGKAKITAKYGKKKKTITITVKKATKKPAATVAVTGVTIDITAPKVGDTLTATVAPANATDPAYQWYRVPLYSSTSGNAQAQKIANQTKSTYTVTPEDRNYVIYVEVTAGGKTVKSSETAAVKAQTIEKFAITGMSQKSNSKLTDPDTAVVGDKLTASVTPAVAANGLTFQWYRDSSAIVGATAQDYTATASDVGHKLSVVAKASNGYEFASGVSTTAALEQTVKYDFSKAVISTDKESVVAGTSVKVTKVEFNGKVVAVADRTVSGKIGTRNLGEATTFDTTKGDAGKSLIISATNKDTTKYIGTATKTLAIGAQIQQQATISGDPDHGQAGLYAGDTMSVTVKDYTNQDVDPQFLSYQWRKDGVDISGATAETYVIPVADATESSKTHEYSVMVTAKDPYSGTATAVTGKKPVNKDQNITAAAIQVNGKDGVPAAENKVYATTGDKLTVVTTPKAAIDAVTVTWTVTKKDTYGRDYTQTLTQKEYTVAAEDVSAQAQVTYTNKDNDGDAWRNDANLNAGTVYFGNPVGTVTLKYTDSQKKATTADPEVGGWLIASVDKAPTGTKYTVYKDKIEAGKGTNAANGEYKIGKDDLGHTLIVVASADKYTSAQAASTKVVASSRTISGKIMNGKDEAATVAVGTTLTATVVDNFDVATVEGGVTYQWQADGKNIVGADKATYKVTAEDAGKVITCDVTPVSPYYAGADKVVTLSTKVTVGGEAAPGTDAKNWTASIVQKTTADGVTLTAKATSTLNNEVIQGAKLSPANTITWYVDGEKVSATDNAITIKNSNGNKSVSVKMTIVYHDGTMDTVEGTFPKATDTEVAE